MTVHLTAPQLATCYFATLVSNGTVTEVRDWLAVNDPDDVPTLTYEINEAADAGPIDTEEQWHVHRDATHIVDTMVHAVLS
jgi:hypothetical protein